MTDASNDSPETVIAFEYDLNEPTHKVWRAISIAEYRQAWLPGDPLADQLAISVTQGQELQYRLRDADPPFLESTVTFRIAPNGSGGTILRIIHRLGQASIDLMASKAANSNAPACMRAA